MEITYIVTLGFAAYSLFMSNLVYKFTKTTSEYKEEIALLNVRAELYQENCAELKAKVASLQSENDKLKSQIKQYENKIKTVTEFFGKAEK